MTTLNDLDTAISQPVFSNSSGIVQRRVSVGAGDVQTGGSLKS